MPAKPLAPLNRLSGIAPGKAAEPEPPAGILSRMGQSHRKWTQILGCTLAAGMLSSLPLKAGAPNGTPSEPQIFEAGFGGAGVAVAGGALGVLLLVSGAVEFRKAGLWTRKLRKTETKAVVVGPIAPTPPIRTPKSLIQGPGEEIPEPSESVVRHEISHVIRTIDEVALRANVLALDAAVEAANSGEAGMGFALVADEVRALAQGTARAARETADTYDECLRRRDSAVKIYATDGQRLSVMVEQARQVHQFVSEIAKICPEARAGRPVETVSTGETTGGRQRLKSQAEALHQCVQDLQALV